MISDTVTITHRLGLHARAAAKFVHLASTFEAKIVVSRDNRSMDGKSILGLLLLAAPSGAVVTVSAEGPDEAVAVEALCRLVSDGFNEVPCST